MIDHTEPPLFHLGGNYTKEVAALRESLGMVDGALTEGSPGSDVSGVVVIVLGGPRGNSFEFQVTPAAVSVLPRLFRAAADEAEREADRMQKHADLHAMRVAIDVALREHPDTPEG